MEKEVRVGGYDRGEHGVICTRPPSKCFSTTFLLHTVPKNLALDTEHSQLASLVLIGHRPGAVPTENLAPCAWSTSRIVTGAYRTARLNSSRDVSLFSFLRLPNPPAPPGSTHDASVSTYTACVYDAVFKRYCTLCTVSCQSPQIYTTTRKDARVRDLS